MKTLAFQMFVAGTQFSYMLVEIGRGHAGWAALYCLASCVGLALAYVAYRRVAA